MQPFKCRNGSCGQMTAVRDINWFSGKHVVECQYCRQWHELRQVNMEEGELIQFEVVGLLDD